MAQLYGEADRVQCYLDLMYIGICYGFYVHMRLSADLQDFFCDVPNSYIIINILES